MAAVDIAGFVSEIKAHAAEHGFHIHAESHFVETYSLHQRWEIDLHPEEACSGPMDLRVTLDVEPRTLLSFEDAVMALDDPDDDPTGEFLCPLVFTWSFPPLVSPPDLLVLATDVAGLGGVQLPLEVSAIDSFHRVTDAADRTLTVVGRVSVSLTDLYRGDDNFICDLLDACRRVSLDLLERADQWIGDR